MVHCSKILVHRTYAVGGLAIGRFRRWRRSRLKPREFRWTSPYLHRSSAPELTMPTYVISDVEILDDDLIATYRSLAQATIDRFGGRYLVRGGTIETVEGDWRPK